MYKTADDGGTVTLYDYTAAYRGGAFVRNENRNADTAHVDRFNSFELTLIKRPTHSRWFATTAFLMTKNHRFLTKVIQSPNDELFNLDQTWDWNYRLAGAYRAAGNVNISSLYTLTNGKAGQRVYLFRQVDPNGGAPISNNGNLTQRLEPFGASRGPLRANWNLKVSKDFSLPNGRKLSPQFDILNVLNSNPSWNTSYVSGPTYGQVTSVQPPRIARFGLAFEF